MVQISRTATSDRNHQYRVSNYVLPVQWMLIGLRQGYHTDAIFNNNESDKFTRITDRDDCALVTYRKGEGGCRVSMRYKEGSTWRANKAEDWTYAGGSHRSTLHLQENTNEGEDEDDVSSYSFRARFGCQTKITGLFITRLEDGIVGM